MASSNDKELDECVRKNKPWSDIPIHLKQVRYAIPDFWVKLFQASALFD